MDYNKNKLIKYSIHDMTSRKIMNGWRVKLYNPTQCELPDEKREVLLDKKYKNIRQAHSELIEILKDYDMKASYSTLRKIGDGSYGGKASKLKESIKFERCELRIEIIEKIN